MPNSHYPPLTHITHSPALLLISVSSPLVTHQYPIPTHLLWRQRKVCMGRGTASSSLSHSSSDDFLFPIFTSSSSLHAFLVTSSSSHVFLLTIFDPPSSPPLQLSSLYSVYFFTLFSPFLLICSPSFLSSSSFRFRLLVRVSTLNFCFQILFSRRLVCVHAMRKETTQLIFYLSGAIQ